MKKLLFYFGFIFIMVLLELLYLNIQLDRKINNIENIQKQYHFSIESMNRMSNKTLNGIDKSYSSKLSAKN